MNQILLWLGLNSSGFKAGIKSANDDIKSISKEWGGLKKGLELGGVAVAVIGFFTTLVEQARSAKGAIDANTQAMRDFGDGAESAWNGIKNAAVQVVGYLGRAGQNIVDMTRYAWNGAEAFEAEAAAVRDSEEGLAQVNKDLAEANKHRAEFLKITEQLKANEEKRAELIIKAMSAEKEVDARWLKVTQIQADLLSLQQEGLSITEFNLKRRQLDLALSEAKVALDTSEVALAKEKAAANAKGFEEDMKWVKEQDAAAKKHREYLLEQKSLSEQITALEAEKAKLTKEAVGDSVKQVQVDEISTQIAEKKVDLARQEAEALAAARKQAEGMAEAQRKNFEIYTKFMNLAVLGGHTSEQIQNSSDAALQKLLSDNAAQAAKLRQEDPGNAFHFGNDLEVTRLENENRRIQNELDQRNDLRNDVASSGLDAARRNYKGDPLLFDDLVDKFTRAQDKTDKTNDLLKDLVTSLNGTSGGQSNIAGQLSKLTSATQAVATVLNTRGIPTG